MHAVHVALGREIAAERFELLIPDEYADVECVAVIPKTPGRYDILDLPTDLITANKVRKSGSYALTVEQLSASKYVVGGTPASRIRFFGDRPSQ